MFQRRNTTTRIMVEICNSQPMITMLMIVPLMPITVNNICCWWQFLHSSVEKDSSAKFVTWFVEAFILLINQLYSCLKNKNQRWFEVETRTRLTSRRQIALEAEKERKQSFDAILAFKTIGSRQNLVSFLNSLQVLLISHFVLSFGCKTVLGYYKKSKHELWFSMIPLRMNNFMFISSTRKK